MTIETATETMRTVRYEQNGEPADVLRLETVPVPSPGPGRIRIAVHACGLAPADWAVVRGLFAGTLPRGIGIDVSGVVDAIGDGVTDVAVGDAVLGSADWAAETSAGASDRAIMNRWTVAPDGLDLTEAAAMPMAIDTAYWHLNWLGLTPGRTILINGAGTTIGFAAVQIALLRGLHVIATAGETYAQRLRDLGAAVTPYGDGLADRVLALHGGPVDVAFDTAPPSGSLPELVRAVGGDPKGVLTASDVASAAALGVRDSFHENGADRPDGLAEFVGLAAAGRFTIPIAQTFPLDQWRTAMEISLGGHARGKLVLLPRATA